MLHFLRCLLLLCKDLFFFFSFRFLLQGGDLDDCCALSFYWNSQESDVLGLQGTCHLFHLLLLQESLDLALLYLL